MNADAPANFLAAYEADADRRERESGQRAQAAHAVAQLSDPAEREIGQYLHAHIASEMHRADLVRLRDLVSAHAAAPGDLSERNKIAFARVLAQGNHSALEALDRELARQLDEEHHAALILLVA